MGHRHFPRVQEGGGDMNIFTIAEYFKWQAGGVRKTGRNHCVLYEHEIIKIVHTLKHG